MKNKKEILDIVNDILTHSYATEEIKAYTLSAIKTHDLLLTALKCLVSGNEPYAGCNAERANQAINKAEVA